MSITGRLLGNVVEKRSAEFGDSSIPPPSESSLGSINGVSVTRDSAMSIMTAYACVGILADAVSTLPLDAIQEVGEDRRPAKQQPALLETPYHDLTIQDWLSQVMVSLLLRGNFYGYIAQRDGIYPTQIMPLNPDAVQVTRNREDNRPDYRIGGEAIDRNEMFHIPGMMMPGDVQGMNPIAYARQGLALAIATEKFGNQFFNNGTHLAGVIQVPGDLEADQARIMAQSFKASHQGLANALLPAIITGGATWQQLSVSPDDAQFLQTRDFQRSEIATFYRVPPHMIGLVDKTTSWGTGIEQQEIGFVRNTLMGWTGRIEKRLSDVLPATAKFNLRARLRGDTLQRFTAYQMARNGSWMNVDEIRALEDMAPLPDGMGEDYWAPLNFAPVDSFASDAGTGPELPPPTGEEPPVKGSPIQ